VHGYRAGVSGQARRAMLDQWASRDWPRAVVMARTARATAGYLLDDISDPALMVNVADPTFSVVGASAGYRRLTGHSVDDVLGRAATEVLSWGAPEHSVSRSANKNVVDFCRMCRDAEMEDISQTAVVQPRTTKEGSQLTVLSLLGFIEVLRKPYVLIVQEPLGEGLLVRVSAERREELTEKCRNTFRRIRRKLQTKAFISNSSDFGPSESDAESVCSVSSQRYVPKRTHWNLRGHRRESVLLEPPWALPDFAFFRDRLQERCILSADGCSASRRELHELQNGCLVFSDRPLRRCSSGLHFEFRVDRVTKSFDGLPLVGFTRRKPTDEVGLHPLVATCLGASVLVGTGCKAYARDKHEHFKMGFRLPPQDEVQTWSAHEGSSHMSCRKISVGDVVACTYTTQGRIQYRVNQEKIFDFDIGRPIQDGVDYYAVLDVCFSAGTVTLLPTPEDATLELELGEDGVSLEPVVRAAASRRVKAPSSFRSYKAVIFSDVRAPLAPLISVGDLSTIEFNANDPASGSSSCSSLPSLMSEDLPREAIEGEPLVLEHVSEDFAEEESEQVQAIEGEPPVLEHVSEDFAEEESEQVQAINTKDITAKGLLPQEAPFLLRDGGVKAMPQQVASSFEKVESDSISPPWPPPAVAIQEEGRRSKAGTATVTFSEPMAEAEAICGKAPEARESARGAVLVGLLACSLATAGLLLAAGRARR